MQTDTLELRKRVVLLTNGPPEQPVRAEDLAFARIDLHPDISGSIHEQTYADRKNGQQPQNKGNILGDFLVGRDRRKNTEYRNDRDEKYRYQDKADSSGQCVVDGDLQGRAHAIRLPLPIQGMDLMTCRQLLFTTRLAPIRPVEGCEGGAKLT